MTVVTKKSIVKWSILLGGVLIVVQGFRNAISAVLPEVALQADIIDIIVVALIWVGLGIYTLISSWPLKERFLVTLNATLISHIYNVVAGNYFGQELNLSDILTLSMILAISVVLWVMYSFFWLQVGRVVYKSIASHKQRKS